MTLDLRVSGHQRLSQAFARACADGGRAALIPYATGGYPSLDGSFALAAAYAEAGADVVEFGVPFSDPLADGPTIQAAAVRALAAGTRAGDVLDLARRLTDRAGADGPPVVLLAYVNTVYAGGGEGASFLARARAAGVAGLVVPDLPVDESGPLAARAADAGVAVIPLAAATTPPARLAAIGALDPAFVYCVATAGVTGARAALDAGLPAFVARCRAAIAAPLAVGFGISTAAQAVEVARHADGVIIGSRLVEMAGDPAAAGAFVAEVREALSARMR